MRTPDGRECRFYYQQANPRYKEIEECRIPKSPQSAHWMPAYCGNCPVPDILLANASPHLEMVLTIKPTFFGFGKKKMMVEAFCQKHETRVDDPYVGCSQCNQERSSVLNRFVEALENNDPTE